MQGDRRRTRNAQRIRRHVRCGKGDGRTLGEHAYRDATWPEAIEPDHVSTAFDVGRFEHVVRAERTIVREKLELHVATSVEVEGQRSGLAAIGVVAHDPPGRMMNYPGPRTKCRARASRLERWVRARAFRWPRRGQAQH